MSYAEEIAWPLIRIFERAVLHKGVRLTGYMANLDFWVKEFRHALDVLEGHDLHFQRMKERRIHYAETHGLEVRPEWSTPTVTPEELNRVTIRLKDAIKHFLRKCDDQGWVTQVQLTNIEQLLGIKHLPDRRPL